MNTNETPNLCSLKAEDFQTVIDGKQTDLYILKNRNGNEVAISNYGGAIVAIMVPDKNGKHANVIQSHDNIQSLVNSPEPYLSTLIGRYGNRICKGRYQLNGKVYQLPVNNGPNSLHGGNRGFNARVWDALLMNEETLILNYVSSYGEERFLGRAESDRRLYFQRQQRACNRVYGNDKQEDNRQSYQSRFLQSDRYGRPYPDHRQPLYAR